MSLSPEIIKQFGRVVRDVMARNMLWTPRLVWHGYWNDESVLARVTVLRNDGKATDVRVVQHGSEVRVEHDGAQTRESETSE